jgi:integrase
MKARPSERSGDVAAKLEKTRHPGVYKRGGVYVFAYRDGNRKQRWESRRTFEEALRAKRARETDVDRGEHFEASRMPFDAYALDWITSYQGRGRRGFREETRAEYTSDLKKYAVPYFWVARRRTVGKVVPRDIAGFIAWLCDPLEQGKALSDARVQNIMKPVRAMFATALERGELRSNPARDVRLPHRPQIENDEDQAQPFPAGVGELVVELVHSRHRLLFELLLATGVRRSELIALEGRHLALNGERPVIKVRQRARRRRGEGVLIGPLKSRYARRDLPIPVDLAERLRGLVTPPEALVFQSIGGTILDPDNLYYRVLKPACEEAGVGWAGFHTFRHSVASRLFAEGRNVVQVQRWLGHHSPSFTLDTYVHLLEDNLGEPLQPGPSPMSAGDQMPAAFDPAASPGSGHTA